MSDRTHSSALERYESFAIWRSVCVIVTVISATGGEQLPNTVLTPIFRSLELVVGHSYHNFHAESTSTRQALVAEDSP